VGLYAKLRMYQFYVWLKYLNGVMITQIDSVCIVIIIDHSAIVYLTSDDIDRQCLCYMSL